MRSLCAQNTNKICVAAACCKFDNFQMEKKLLDLNEHDVKTSTKMNMKATHTYIYCLDKRKYLVR